MMSTCFLLAILVTGGGGETPHLNFIPEFSFQNYIGEVVIPGDGRHSLDSMLEAIEPNREIINYIFFRVIAAPKDSFLKHF
jgi:hypothetical protein